MKNIFRLNFTKSIRMIGNRISAGAGTDRFSGPGDHQREAKGAAWDAAAFAAMEEAEVYEALDTCPEGLAEFQVQELQERYGENRISRGEKISLAGRLWKAFVNPFSLILCVLALVSLFTEVIWAEPGEKNPASVIIIGAMVLVSGVLRLVQETRSGNAAARLSRMLKTTACVERIEEGPKEIPMEEIVPGDVVHLAAGDMIPADMRILEAKDLFVSQSALTGESEPVEKTGEPDFREVPALEKGCLAFMGTSVVSGSARGVAAAVGDSTLLGSMAGRLEGKKTETSFEKGVNSVSWMLVRLMLVMVPVVLALNGFVKGNWLHAVLFAISIAIGLTPEMLPVIVTACLARGAVAMSRRRVIMKDLNAIQNLGSMDILCTDKTGTLTQDKIVLERHLNVDGKEDDRILRHAFLNSWYQTGLRNLLDRAVIERTESMMAGNPELEALEKSYTKVDEIPFDFQRRRMSVVVEDRNGKRQLITKGAAEEMLQVCAFVEYQGQVVPLTEEMRNKVMESVNRLNEKGMRVLGLGQKTNPSPAGAFSAEDEKDMVLMGYLAFLDLPKPATAGAVEALHSHGVDIKVLTGDNEKVACCICDMVGIPSDTVLLGADLDRMSDRELEKEAEKVSVFAKLSPEQKARVVETLRRNGHCVGYLGDGINDSAAMKAADVGISVDNAVDMAKECAQVILLEKDLLVLEQGVLEGRKVYANMMKYIRLTAASNFGNMFSVLAASVFLPFLPMEAIQILLLNMVYDVACTALPWDHVDEESLRKPCVWDASSVETFMFRMGPVSSVFDILTYLLLYFVICPAVWGGSYHTLDAASQAGFTALFQTGWFVESMWTQTLVIHFIRTGKIPFLQSRASAPVLVSTLLSVAALTLLPFLPIGKDFGLLPLPGSYFGWLVLITAGYMAATVSVNSLLLGNKRKAL